VLIVYNPTAGRRRIHRLWLVLDILSASGVTFDVVQTLHPGHAAELARQASRNGARTVVAAGGDGTIADVAAGLIGSTTKLGIIPLGTANVLANELGLDFAPKEIAACLAFGRGRELWPGIAESPAGTRLFVQMLGAGFDAQVVHRICAPLKRLIGRGAYVAQTLCELASYKFPRLDLRLDGERLEGASVIVSKGRLYGGPYLLAPEAHSNRPGFTVAIFHHRGQLPALIYGAALPFNLLPQAPGLELRRAQRIELSSPAPTPVQADGDRAGFLPLSVRNANGPITVVVGK
jgi:YegS/Rv2252/BmrU family lipid kinase